MDVYSRKSVRTDYQPSVVREAESLSQPRRHANPLSGSRHRHGGDPCRIDNILSIENMQAASRAFRT